MANLVFSETHEFRVSKFRTQKNSAAVRISLQKDWVYTIFISLRKKKILTLKYK